jgi:uncharacterized Tic20 family protein
MSQTPPEGQTQQSHQQAPQPLSPDQERLWSLLSHLSFFVLGIILPAIVMLTLGTRSQYVRHNAVQALNFHVTVWVASAVAALTILIAIGVILLPAVLIVAAVLTVLAAVQSYHGVLYRYPFSIPLIV